LFYPLWPLMWIVYRLVAPKSSPSGRGQGEGASPRMTSRDWLREAGMLALQMVIGLYVLNLGYGFEGSFTQLKAFHFVSDLFTGRSVDDSLRESNGEASPHTEREGYTNRFTNTWLGDLPVPIPKNYLLGINIQQKDFEHYGRQSYLRGVWQDHGWRYYYLYACAIKVPLGMWTLGFLVLIFRLMTSDQRLTTPLRDEFILLFPALVIFAIVSSKTGFSAHMRYILPIFPYLFIWISQLAQIFMGNLSRGRLISA